MMADTIYDKPAQFDGEKFATRYGLSVVNMDFWDDGKGHIVVKDGITIPDNPPIWEGPDDPEVVIRKRAKLLLALSRIDSCLVRAVAATLLDELNSHADKINSILSAVDAATSLADLKSRIALINDYPQRTLAQAKTSILNKIDSGEAD